MNDDTERTKRRFLELAERAARTGVPTRTNFLTLAEQDLLSQLGVRALAAPFTLAGGADDAERKRAVFGGETPAGDPPDSEIVCVRIAPRSEKFGEPLAHRDCLGAILHLGLARDALGDIVTDGGAAFVFCTGAAADLLCRELTQVRHTPVVCAVAPVPPQCAQPELIPAVVRVSSPRLDALIARAFDLSREESAELFRQGRVFLGGAPCSSPSFQPAPDTVISVRGHGRLIYRGVDGTTRKGALRVRIDLPAGSGAR